LKTGRGQDEIREQEIDRPFVLCTDLEGFRTAVGMEDSETCLLKDCCTELYDGRLVIDH
jgi:hypothetical protein